MLEIAAVLTGDRKSYRIVYLRKEALLFDGLPVISSLLDCVALLSVFHYIGQS